MQTSKRIHFWNGNKSPVRKSFEKELLQICLQHACGQNVELITNETDYPEAAVESNIFSNNCDVLVTVAGNQKFVNKPKIVIEIPVCKGILGHRLMIVEQKNAERFTKINSVVQLTSLTIGIPATWADAEIFRFNGCKVQEKGNLDDIFMRLCHREFDYIALGANEIQDIFTHYKLADLGLMIEPSLLIYYPLPLVFYVHPEKQNLAKQITDGLTLALSNGQHQQLFDKYHPSLATRLGISDRRNIYLKNPHLPPALKAFTPSFGLIKPSLTQVNAQFYTQK